MMSSIIPVFIPHVGCPHDCVFCNQKKIAGKTEAPDGESVRNTIEEALGKLSGEISEVAFYGGSFTAIERPLMIEYLEAAKPFLDEGKVSGIRLSTRPDSVDEEVLSVLQNYGVKTIELGTQSMDETVLEASGRGHTADDVRCASRLIKEAGFSLILQMMTHLPKSDREKDIFTANEIARLSPDGVRVYPTVVVRDTYLEKMMRNEEYTPCTPDEAASLGGEILGIFKAANIPVIRFGLNPTDDLSGGEALAGAYHPALGEMAMSAYFLMLCEKEISKAENEGDSLEIMINPKRISAMTGQKKKNKEILSEKYGFREIKVMGTNEMPDGKVSVRIYKKS